MTTNSGNGIDVRQLEHVVCVMGHMHAASSLMLSLLDNHPNLLNMPDNTLRRIYGFWEKYGHLPADQLVSSFLVDYAFFFDAWAPSPEGLEAIGEMKGWTDLGAEHDEVLMVDKEIFKSAMKKLIGDEQQISRKLFFQSLHLAYSEALGRQVKDPQILFGLQNFHPQFIIDFPDSNFLQMVRHPIQALGSNFKLAKEDGFIYPSAGANLVGMALSGPFIPREGRSRWRGVRMETVHQNLKETMQKICDWLQLPWDESLLKSTVIGKQWWNEKNDHRVSGTGNVFIEERFDEYIPSFDQFRLNVLSSKICQAHGYEVKARYRWVATKLFVLPLLLIPFKIELLSLFSVRWVDFDRGVSTMDPRTKSFLARVPGALQAVYRGRRVMLLAWLRLFTKDKNQIEMI